MNKTFKEKLAQEHTRIARCIFRGLTITQIAQELNCSNSTVSNRMCSLFEKYSAKTRFDFILRVLGGIIDANKQTIDTQLRKISCLENENKEIKKILKDILKNKNKKEEMDSLLEDLTSINI